MSAQPVISGIGLITPLGTNVQETWDALMAGRHIEDHARVPLEFDPTLPRVSCLAIRAAREAAGTSDLTNAALVVGTSKGPVERWLAPQSSGAMPSQPGGGMLNAGTFEQEQFQKLATSPAGGARVPRQRVPPPSRLSDVASTVRMGLSCVATHIAHELGIGGPRLTVSAACASGLHALIRGSMLIQSGQYNRVLVVAAEASVHPLFLASFARLGVLPPSGFGCRPFDKTRAGFLMSEAAAAVLLENRDSAGPVVIDRFAIAADATHLTGMDPQTLALRRVLATVLGDTPTQLLHAHGTGTPMNDALELAALDELIPQSVPTPIVYSHKGALGHSLGAAGLVSVVLNVMSHRTGHVPPNPRTSDPLSARRVVIPHGSSRQRIERSLAVAAGFGGAMAAVSLSSNA